MAVPKLEFAAVDGNDQLDVVLRRFEWIYRLFEGGSVDYHTKVHREYDKFMNVNAIEPAPNPSPLPSGSYELPETISFAGSERHGVEGGDFRLRDFIDEVNVMGVAVVHEGALVHESYYRDHDASTRWMTNSASKLVISMLCEAALEDGSIKSFEDQLTDYWPELADTAWNGTSIGDCLRMKSGMHWEEEDLELFRDCHWTRFFHEVAFGRIEDYLVGMERAHSPGSFLNYSSLDTEMLGSILSRATGSSIAEYVERKLWKPGGMESGAYWVCDSTNREMALSGLCATLRDYARFGWLMANDGKADGVQVLPRGFTEVLSSPGPELFDAPGADAWVLVPWMQSFVSSDAGEAAGDFMACGSYGQIIYANPKKRTAIAVQSMYPDISNEYPDMYRQFIACRQIASELDRSGIEKR